MLRTGLVAVDIADRRFEGPEFALQVQPFRRQDVPWSGVFVGLRGGADPFGTFSSYSRGGAQLGYIVLVSSRNGWASAGVSLAGVIDSWDVFNDDPEGFSGDGTGLGVAVRPFIRLWRIELSLALERGHVYGLDESYESNGFQLGAVLF